MTISFDGKGQRIHCQTTDKKEMLNKLNVQSIATQNLGYPR